MCTEKRYKASCATAPESRASFAEDTYGRIPATWKRINANLRTTVLPCNFPLMDDGCFVSSEAVKNGACLVLLLLAALLLSLWGKARVSTWAWHPGSW